MISVQFTIRGDDFENIKVRIEADNMGALLTDMQAIEMSAARLFRTYETFIQVRDMGHQEAVEAVVQRLGAVDVTAAVEAEEKAAWPAPSSDEGHALTEDPSKPFWEDKKPWERKQPSPEPAVPTAGQSVNLL